MWPLSEFLKPGHIVRDRPVPYYVTSFQISETRPHSTGQTCPVLCGLFPNSKNRPHSTGQNCPVLCGLFCEFPDFETRPHSTGQTCPVLCGLFSNLQTKPHSTGQTCPVLCDRVSQPLEYNSCGVIIWAKFGVINWVKSNWCNKKSFF